MPKRSSFLSILFLLPLFFVQCTTVPGTDRKALHLVPHSHLESMSVTAFQEMKQQTPISTNKKYLAQADRVSKRIAEAVKSDLPDVQWEFIVFEDNAVNAFAMAGGKVGIYTGLLQLVKSDDELAAVVGHEIAHVTARHSNERMSQQLVAQGLSIAAVYGSQEMSEETRNILLAAVGLGSQYGVLLPFSRLHESEADKIGLIYAARAGYDPRAAISFWESMKSLKQGSPPEWMSTHPNDDTRIKKLQEWMPEALKVYEANKR